ncbi:hypothetical protein IGJ28_002009 [Enterococcus sp. AZ091]|uniref:recombinase family protein n=1 Tax=Enterococcus sp. AZ091 TaxID=2774720 RepID=UPI003F28228B
MKKYAYIRVSSKDQNIDRQVMAMESIGLIKKQMIIDYQTGKDFNRQNYRKLVKKLKRGDELYIKSIDRLGRNYDEILAEWRYLTEVKKINIIVLDFPLLDTRHKVNGITGKFLADLVLQVLSYVAQVERENINQRQREGIKVAKEKGIKFGRPKKEYPDNFDTVAELWKKGTITLREGADLLDVSHTTFSRWVKQYNFK